MLGILIFFPQDGGGARRNVRTVCCSIIIRSMQVPHGSRIKTDSQFIFKIHLNIGFLPCFSQDGDEDMEGCIDEYVVSV